MRRSRIVLSIAAVLLLSAGVVVGMLSTQLKAGRPVPPAGHGGRGDRGPGWFSEALELTPDQRKQMDGIWTDTKQQIGKTWDHKRDLDRRRDADVRALLTPQQAAAYDKVWADYRAARAAIDQDRDRLVHDANDRSKALLTDAQKGRWEQMSKDMHDHHGGPGNGGPGNGGVPGDGGPPGGRPPPATSEADHNR